MGPVDVAIDGHTSTLPSRKRALFPSPADSRVAVVGSSGPTSEINEETALERLTTAVLTARRSWRQARDAGDVRGLVEMVYAVFVPSRTAAEKARAWLQASGLARQALVYVASTEETRALRRAVDVSAETYRGWHALHRAGVRRFAVHEWSDPPRVSSNAVPRVLALCVDWDFVELFEGTWSWHGVPQRLRRAVGAPNLPGERGETQRRADDGSSLPPLKVPPHRWLKRLERYASVGKASPSPSSSSSPLSS